MFNSHTYHSLGRRRGHRITSREGILVPPLIGFLRVVEPQGVYSATFKVRGLSSTVTFITLLDAVVATVSQVEKGSTTNLQVFRHAYALLITSGHRIDGAYLLLAGASVLHRHASRRLHCIDIEKNGFFPGGINVLPAIGFLRVVELQSDRSATFGVRDWFWSFISLHAYLSESGTLTSPC